ncbi:hypothetical protein PENTCL1PPCAC_9156, partial [Pristionchus entomophagus]
NRHASPPALASIDRALPYSHGPVLTGPHGTTGSARKVATHRTTTQGTVISPMTTMDSNYPDTRAPQLLRIHCGTPTKRLLSTSYSIPRRDLLTVSRIDKVREPDAIRDLPTTQGE